MSSNENLEEKSTIPEINANIEGFTKKGFQILIEATKAANKLPSGTSRDYYESFPSFHKAVKAKGERILSMLHNVLKHSGSKGNISRREDEEKFEMIVDANDTIFERVGILLDELAGIRENPGSSTNPKLDKIISGPWNNNKTIEATRAVPTSAINATLNASKCLEKPQNKFTDKIDNHRDTVFVPRIKFKHNLLKPLAILPEIDGQYSHPYEFELDKYEPSEELLKICTPTPFKSLEETKFTFVTNQDQVEEMLAHMRTVKEISIDLEHHSYRSYQGFTCLMQISTRFEDFVIDTLSLRDKLECLNEILTDPKVLKVFHGAQSDIQWLQRDLSLYVVNMFDTYIAAKLLNYPRLSLAFLLAKFCDVQALKYYQLADWRVRPIPEEMLKYAREDTHYLLYIFDMLRNELMEKANGLTNLLKSVFTESTQLCLIRYVKPIWDDEEHLKLYHKSKRLFDNRQLYALKYLYEWRDNTARELDESIGYVLPNHMLLHIADNLPREMQGILACCNPVPPLVRQHLTQLHQIILRARNQPSVPSVQLDQAPRGVETTISSTLRCPHDLTWEPEFRSDLPCLLNEQTSNREDCVLWTDRASFDFVTTTTSARLEPTRLTPYQRYKLSKNYAVEKAIEEAKKVATAEKVSADAPPKPIVIKKQKKKEEKKTLKEQVDLRSKKKRKTETPLPNLKKKKLNETQFDYESVDYGKFQSGRKVQLSAPTQKIKHKRGKKGKFKIAI